MKICLFLKKCNGKISPVFDATFPHMPVHLNLTCREFTTNLPAVALGGEV